MGGCELEHAPLAAALLAAESCKNKKSCDKSCDKSGYVELSPRAWRALATAGGQDPPLTDVPADAFIKAGLRYICVHVSTSVCVYIYLYISRYIYIYRHIHAHTYTHARRLHLYQVLQASASTHQHQRRSAAAAAAAATVPVATAAADRWRGMDANVE